MDWPALHLLLLPDHWNLLGYLGWMLWHGSLPLTACKPEGATELVLELEPDLITVLESTHATQSTPEPGADLNLTDLWSTDPVPKSLPSNPRLLHWSCPDTVPLESLWTPCRICENVKNFNKIKEIIQNACYFLFSTVLIKIFYIKDVYI